MRNSLMRLTIPLGSATTLSNAFDCLQQLGRADEEDGLLEKVIAAHAGNWRLLRQAADIYYDQLDHTGYIIAGKFVRGDHRGGTAHTCPSRRAIACALCN